MMTEPSPTDLPRGHQYPNDGRNSADPSALTVAMLDKAIAQLREFYDAQIDDIKRSIELAHEDIVRGPTLLQQSIVEIKELYNVKISNIKELLEAELKSSMAIRNEKFVAVDRQFEALDRRAKDLDEARATALVAALAAAKELVGAANVNFTKQIDGLQISYAGQLSALDEKVNDLRDRLTQLSSITQGGADANSRRRADVGSIAGIVSAASAILVILGSLVVFIVARPVLTPAVQYMPAPTVTPAPVMVAPR